MDKKERLEYVSVICNIISSFSIIIAALTLIINIYPQIIWWNDDCVAKAKAGDEYSQIILAEHYYEIGEYDEAIYWYKMASLSNNKMYKSVACNNLGYLYANGYGLSDYEKDGYRRYEIAFELFKKAIQEGCVKSESNVLTLLKTNSRDYFPTIDYDLELAELAYDEESIIESTGIEYRQISKGAVFWENNVKYTGGQRVNIGGKNGIIQTAFVYRYQIYEANIEIEDYYFIYLEDVESN